MTSPASIVEGLSEAQRAALLSHKTTQAWGGRDDWRLPSWQDAGHALRRAYLIDFVSDTSSMTELTEEGLAVREHLLRSNGIQE